MTPKTKSAVVLSLGLAVLAAGCGHPQNISQEEPGRGREEFVTACVVCHSPRYITMQPQFPRTTWLSEVKKMKDVYGAHISDEQALKIADYLFSINGKAGAVKGPKGTYGE